MIRVIDTIPSRTEAQAAYHYLFAVFIADHPYRGGESNDSDAQMAARGGFVAALTKLAMVAFGLNKEQAEEYIVEDYQDYAASLG